MSLFEAWTESKSNYNVLCVCVLARWHFVLQIYFKICIPLLMPKLMSYYHPLWWSLVMKIRITIYFLLSLSVCLCFSLPYPIFSSYPSWCAPRSRFFHLSLPDYTSLLFQLLLLHADFIPTAQPLATPPCAQGCPRPSSQIPDYCFVEGSGRGCGCSSSKWSITEPCQN